MNIWMMTNTYTPFVGGVAKSVLAFTGECRKAGHRVLVVAPEFEGAPASEEDVVRIPAIQDFNGSDFSVALPIPGYLRRYFETCRPDVVHSHHPHFLGNTAVRVASRFERPLVFTHHTMYEHYLHYVPAEAKRMRDFVIALATGYCNLCDRVIAPSESVADVLRERGVATPIVVIPTGVDVQRFGRGDGSAFRRKHGISKNARLAGYVGRLAPEKNLSFLARAICRWTADCPDGHFLVVGSGPSAESIRQTFVAGDLAERLHLVGSLEGQELVDAYHAMDAFVFASYSETQGMVLTEAMAAGTPVVALSGPGVREVIDDGQNGRLLEFEDEGQFAEAVAEVAEAPASRRQAFDDATRSTAQEFSLEQSGQKLLRVYEDLMKQGSWGPRDESAWRQAREEIKAEWELLKNMAGAVGNAFKESS